MPVVLTKWIEAVGALALARFVAVLEGGGGMVMRIRREKVD